MYRGKAVVCLLVGEVIKREPALFAALAFFVVFCFSEERNGTYRVLG